MKRVVGQSLRRFSMARENNVLVLGGSGYVGSNVVQEALRKGCTVFSLSRSGKPTNCKEDWVEKVTWISGDALAEPNDELQNVLQKSKGVISCVGGFGSNAFMEKICGDVTIAGAQHAQQAGVPNFAFISAHDYKKFPQFLLRSGYFNGKRRAEAEISRLFKGRGTVLRPGMVYGTRRVGNWKLPLGLVGLPLELITNNGPVQSLNRIPVLGSLLEAALVPPVPVTAVARAAVEAVLAETVEEADEARIIDIEGILKYK